MVRILQQPLLHFLVLGALLFVFLREPESALESGAEDRLIRVDRQSLLDYLQYQAKAFEPTLFGERLAAMSEQELERVIQNFVREEALYREALRMRMEEGDYIIKQRLVQKVEFLLENTLAEAVAPSEEALDGFYRERIAEYEVAPVYSFTHVFFDAGRGGMDEALQRAKAAQSRVARLRFDEASQLGDRFPFLQNYVERTQDFVVNNFGADFIDSLQALEPSDTEWRGPLASRYGYHFVMLIARQPATTPPLAEIRERVLDDYRYEAIVRSRQQAEQEVIAGYQVVVDLEPTP
jgi:hypothetical protein